MRRLSPFSTPPPSPPPRPSGKKLPFNMKDAEWFTWTLSIGFDVMGIWPDGSDGTDVNAVDRGRLGAPIFDPYGALAYTAPGRLESSQPVCSGTPPNRRHTHTATSATRRSVRHARHARPLLPGPSVLPMP